MTELLTIENLGNLGVLLFLQAVLGFSFDSILSALAITDVFVVLAIAIVLSGLAMLLLADSVSDFS